MSSPTKPRRPQNVRLPPAPVLRMLLLGSIAVAGSIWAVVRHYTHPLPPMVVPVPSATATPDFDEDAGEHEIPIEMLYQDD